jgi:hypothetical protein
MVFCFSSSLSSSFSDLLAYAAASSSLSNKLPLQPKMWRGYLPSDLRHKAELCVEESHVCKRSCGYVTNGRDFVATKLLYADKYFKYHVVLTAPRLYALSSRPDGSW